MPKIVDHATRRREIAAALWRVAARDGVGAVSVRTVAAESGWSPSAIRHYFSTQSELLTFAMSAASERISDRIDTAATGGDGPRPVAEARLEEVLPLDDERRVDALVWLTFVAQLQHDPALRPLADEFHRRLRGLCRTALETLRDAGLVAEGLDLRTETDRLHALLDGLALHGSLYPRLTSRRRIRTALRTHLDELARDT